MRRFPHWTYYCRPIPQRGQQLWETMENIPQEPNFSYPDRFERFVSLMARGQQKIQSQQKNAAKKAAAQKGATSLADQKKAAAKALTHSCPVCKVVT
ncbi:Zinc finger protein 706 [Plakobranchus ocellatus]|uniref:Zinc finger protein 706 n=1 Tax=Plakobranchus ocellatus TaxID=259542 RepID=A0AAV4AW14_9GAST|nr:Zinc finger protein 706 [Plakobranchus ocellatus]